MPGHEGAILLDVNVWLAFLLNTEGPQRPVSGLIGSAGAVGAQVVTTASIRKDVFYIAGREMRRMWRADHPGGDMSLEDSLLVRDVTWTCLEQMDELATIVPESMREDFLARHLRGRHDDYEDDLLVGTAQAVGAWALVTYDEGLLRHFPELCMTPETALGRLEA